MKHLPSISNLDPRDNDPQLLDRQTLIIRVAAGIRDKRAETVWYIIIGFGFGLDKSEAPYLE
jgi:hypothetical protein